jgi:hypothetical protein
MIGEQECESAAYDDEREQKGEHLATSLRRQLSLEGSPLEGLDGER